MSLKKTLLDPRIWRGQRFHSAHPVVPTGFEALDRYLPGGGWPLAAITEIFLDHYGIGELQLLIPALVRLSRREARDKKWIVWVAPPFVPYAPALLEHGIDLDCLLIVHPKRAQKAHSSAGNAKRLQPIKNGGNRRSEEANNNLWAVEQTIRSGSSIAVLAWVQSADDADLRRLQLAAEERCCWVVLFRPVVALQNRSPAAIRMKLHAEAPLTRVEIAKCRGRAPAVISLETQDSHEIPAWTGL